MPRFFTRRRPDQLQPSPAVCRPSHTCCRGVRTACGTANPRPPHRSRPSIYHTMQLTSVLLGVDMLERVHTCARETQLLLELEQTACAETQTAPPRPRNTAHASLMRQTALHLQRRHSTELLQSELHVFKRAHFVSPSSSNPIYTHIQSCLCIHKSHYGIMLRYSEHFAKAGKQRPGANFDILPRCSCNESGVLPGRHLDTQYACPSISSRWRLSIFTLGVPQCELACPYWRRHLSCPRVAVADTWHDGAHTQRSAQLLCS